MVTKAQKRKKPETLPSGFNLGALQADTRGKLQ